VIRFDPRHPWTFGSRGARVLVGLALSIAIIAPGVVLAEPAAARKASAPQSPPATSASSLAFTYSRESEPARTVVTDGSGRWVATLTDGARTVSLAGPSRRFSERTAGATVEHGVWVRALESPYSGTVDETWLRAALNDTSPDVLAVGMQYVEGASDVTKDGQRIAGDADYGPLQPDGTRQEGSDFNDYLGRSWTYGSSVDEPEGEQPGVLTAPASCVWSGDTATASR